MALCLKPVPKCSCDLNSGGKWCQTPCCVASFEFPLVFSLCVGDDGYDGVTFRCKNIFVHGKSTKVIFTNIIVRVNFSNELDLHKHFFA